MRLKSFGITDRGHLKARNNAGPEDIAEGLLDLALDNGGRDNIAVIVIRAE